jgi:hypothetical protein
MHMTEAATETTATTEGDATQTEGATTDTTEAPQTDTTDWKAEARKWEQRAKDNGAKANEFDKQRKAAMTDAERAVAEAEERGRTAATTEFGHELARTRFDALAGRRNKDFDTAQALEFVDLGKFLGEDGRPDDKAITAAVERLVPAPADGAPSFDGGTRTPTAPQTGMTGLIRKAAGRA